MFVKSAILIKFWGNIITGAWSRRPKADRLRNTVDFSLSTFLQCLTCFFTSKASKVNLFVYDEISSVSFKFNSSLLKDREKLPVSLNFKTTNYNSCCPH